MQKRHSLNLIHNKHIYLRTSDASESMKVMQKDQKWD